MRPLKRFSQNFLKSPYIQRQIVYALEITNQDDILEIGPGQGALTSHIIEQVPRSFTAVEVDQRLCQSLRNKFPQQVRIVEADFLKVDWADLLPADSRIKVVGNIPYHISSPIIFKLLDAFHSIRRAVIMTQKEVAHRIAADPGGKDYGILSVMAQTYGRVAYLFTVKKGNFYPVPAVDSAVVQIDFFETLTGVADERLYRRIVRQVFNYRRKMLRNSLSGIFDKNNLNSLNSVNLERRPEELSVQNFKDLANEIHAITGHPHD